MYKLQTYEGKSDKVHFKDIYQILVKRVFKEEFDDFDLSKYLKTKMKNQWVEKHKKVKELTITGFRAHQSFSTQIIGRIRKEVLQPKQIDKTKYVQYANYNNVPVVKRDQSDSRGDSRLSRPKKSVDSDGAQFSKIKPSLHHSKTVDLSPVINQRRTMDFKQFQRGKTKSFLPPIEKKRNNDENPQEFEEVES